MIGFTTAFAKLAAKAAAMVAAIAAMGLTTLLLTASAFAAEDHDVDLKLFGEADVSSSSGCWFSLWQKNRDPAKDKYAYVFYAPISGGVEDTARMKIGKEFVALSRDGNWRDNGRELAPTRLYASDDNKIRVIVDITKQRAGNAFTLVDAATVTVIQRKRFPFVNSAKGFHGCHPDGGLSKSAAPAKEELSVKNNASRQED